MNENNLFIKKECLKHLADDVKQKAHDSLVYVETRWFHFEGFLLLLDIILHYVTLATSFALASELYGEGRKGLCGLVILFTLLPCPVTFAIIVTKEFLLKNEAFKKMVDIDIKTDGYENTVFTIDWLCCDDYYGESYKTGDEDDACCGLCSRRRKCAIVVRAITVFIRSNRLLSIYKLYNAEKAIMKQEKVMRGEAKNAMETTGKITEETTKKIAEEIVKLNDKIKIKRTCKRLSEAEYLIEGFFTIVPIIWLDIYFYGEFSQVSIILIISVFLALLDFFFWICQAQYWRYLKIKKQIKKEDPEIYKSEKKVFLALFWTNVILAPFYIFTSLPTISLFSAVYHKFVMFAHLVMYVILWKEFWWWRRKTMIHDINLSFRLIYLLFKLLAKLMIFGMICVWFVRVMTYVAVPGASVPAAVPNAIWPNPNPFFKHVAYFNRSSISSTNSTPSWIKPCAYKDVYFLACKNFTDPADKLMCYWKNAKSILSFLDDARICNAVIAPYIFCIVFWMNVLYIFFDVIRCILIISAKASYTKKKAGKAVVNLDGDVCKNDENKCNHKRWAMKAMGDESTLEMHSVPDNIHLL